MKFIVKFNIQTFRNFEVILSNMQENETCISINYTKEQVTVVEQGHVWHVPYYSLGILHDDDFFINLNTLWNLVFITTWL
jgi:hypothetical protein